MAPFSIYFSHHWKRPKFCNKCKEGGGVNSFSYLFFYNGWYKNSKKAEKIGVHEAPGAGGVTIL